jgi:hypothetical protein
VNLGRHAHQFEHSDFRVSPNAIIGVCT